MTQDHLGLFNTPPSRAQIRSGLTIVGLTFLVGLLTFPVGHIRLREVNAFIPIVDTAMFVCQLITATLLYAKSTVYRSRALVVLASGYIFVALMLIPHMLTFPGVFAPDGLLGAGINTTGWIALTWRAAFPIAVLFYVALKRLDEAAQPGTGRPAAKIGMGVLAAGVLAAAVTLLTTIGQDLLPPVMSDHREVIYPNVVLAYAVLIALSVVAIAVLFRARNSALDMWLLVSLSAWLVQVLLNLSHSARFTIGFYALNGMMLVSSLILMLALIEESYRLHMRLALATAARARERDVRLMSMDAVAAAIAHEVGQPIAAVTTNGMAGLHWLTHVPPDPQKAIEAVRATIDAGRRTNDVIKSVRSMFAKGPGTATEFNLNALARETASLLDREMGHGKVSLELALDEALPPIIADRVQIQRVLLNLLINAIESLGATQGRPRRIAIRSTRLDDEDVLLEISDSGIGIAPGEIEHIFDAFVTTKAAGTGLGLSLCRTIVEEHGGRLWATPAEDHGATFRMQLPCRGVPAP